MSEDEKKIIEDRAAAYALINYSGTPNSDYVMAVSECASFVNQISE